MAVSRTLVAAALMLLATGAALAQSAGASSSGSSGSGSPGSSGPSPSSPASSGGVPTGHSAAGPETPAEAKADSDAAKATTICKGC